jgi:hypothetical protein
MSFGQFLWGIALRYLAALCVLFLQQRLIETLASCSPDNLTL